MSHPLTTCPRLRRLNTDGRRSVATVCAGPESSLVSQTDQVLTFGSFGSPLAAGPRRLPAQRIKTNQTHDSSPSLAAGRLGGR